MSTPTTPPEMQSVLDELVARSRSLAADPRWVQAGGGNVSLKSGTSMAVKASGVWLASMQTPQGFSMLHWPTLSQHVQHLAQFAGADLQKRADTLDRELASQTPSPSIESWLHALVGNVGVHLHPNAALCHLCAESLEIPLRLVRDSVAGSWPVVGVPYATPGLPLALALKQALDQANIPLQAPGLIALFQNHGLLTAAPTCEQAFELALLVNQTLESALPARIPSESPITATAKGADTNGQVAPYSHPAELQQLLEFTARLASRTPSFAPWNSPSAATLASLFRQRLLDPEHVYFPDQAVYCGPEILWLDSHSPDLWQQAWDSYLLRWFTEPGVVVHSSGFAALNAPAGQRVVAKTQVLETLVELGLRTTTRLRPLSRQDVNALLFWDRETHRQNVTP